MSPNLQIATIGRIAACLVIPDITTFSVSHSTLDLLKKPQVRRVTEQLEGASFSHLGATFRVVELGEQRVRNDKNFGSRKAQEEFVESQKVTQVLGLFWNSNVTAMSRSVQVEGEVPRKMGDYILELVELSLSGEAQSAYNKYSDLHEAAQFKDSPTLQALLASKIIDQFISSGFYLGSIPWIKRFAVDGISPAHVEKLESRRFAACSLTLKQLAVPRTSDQ